MSQINHVFNDFTCNKHYKNESEEKTIFKQSIIDKLIIENIPTCNNCLIDLNEGNYICKKCYINLCYEHAIDHHNKFYKSKINLSEKSENNHNFIELVKQ